MRDFRYALRLLRKSPGFTTVAVLTLALGIGANTAVFSIVEGALLRPLPYRDPGRLVNVLDRSTREAGVSKLFDSYADYQEYSRNARSFDGIAAATWATRGPILTGHGAPRGITAIPVSDSFFRVLGVSPELGRTFTTEDLSRGCSVVLSHGFWTGHLGGDRSLIGQPVTLDRRPCTVVGVMPASFAFYPQAAEMWTLITPDTPSHPVPNIVIVVGRLQPGVTAARAEAELTALHSALHRGDRERDFAPAVDYLQDDFTWLAGRNLRTTLWVLLAAVGMVLLIACFNVGSLLLGRSLVRAREMAVRAALGGGRARLIRQLLAEGLVLSSVGTALGILLAFGAVRWFRAVNPVELPVGANIDIQLPVLLFAVALSATTALLFGLAPAWKTTGVDVNLALKSAGRGSVGTAGRQGLGRALVASEVALSVMLLAGAGLLMESVVRMGSTPLGYDFAGVIDARLDIPPGTYHDPARRLAFYDSLQAHLAASPGVEHVAFTSVLPPAIGSNFFIDIFGKPPTDRPVHDVAAQWISPDYFQTLDVPLHRGRNFDPHDRQDSLPVAIVDEALAREYFANSDPIGARIRVDNEGPWATIVGIVATQKRSTVYREMDWVDTPTVFRPLAQNPDPSAALVIRASADAAATAALLRREVAALDADVAVGSVEPMNIAISRILSYPRFRAAVLSGFAAFALLLATIGLQGVLAQMVAQRTQEIGVRLAVGASPADIIRLVVRQAGAPVLAGLVVGLGSALALGRYLGSILYGTRPHDPLTLLAVSLALLAASAAAISLPARRAARIDPLLALRQE